MSLIGWFVLWASVFGTNQLAIQRYSSLPTLSDARKALFWTMPGFLLLAMAAVTIGLIALADFYNCNPLETGEIASRDQLIIHFARKVLRTNYYLYFLSNFCNFIPADLLPGLFGLYLSCLLSASLSTLSSGINSISAVIFTDFIKPIVGKKLSPCQAMTINKVCSWFYFLLFMMSIFYSQLFQVQGLK
jgi:sodium-coupled monocarboxylate transporter 8/12